MSNKKLLQYLKEAAVLECQLYTQNQLYWRLKNQADTLGHRRYYEKPILGNWIPDFSGWIGVSCALGFSVSCIGIFFVDEFVDLVKLFLALSLFFYIGIIFLDYSLYCSKKKEFVADLKEYNANVDADQLRVRRELDIKAQLEKQYTEVSNEWHNTRNALDSLYELGIIHKKYRNLVPIASFYDYFDTGRCFVLKGPGGAYATYEEDLRFQRLETKLDVIITKLDEIIENQRMLADLMRESNDTLMRIEQASNRSMHNIERIEENLELTAYNTRCTMQSAAVMEHLLVYNTLRDHD